VFIEAKDDGGGGDNWSYKSCKYPVKSPPPTNQHPCEVYSSLVGYLIKIRVSIQKRGVRSINVIKFHYKNET